MTLKDLETIIEKCSQYSSSNAADRPHEMVLTLGHAYLDDLVNAICSAKVYPQLPLPYEICSKLRPMEGEDREPWRTFRSQRSVAFVVHFMGKKTTFTQIENRSLVDYLAACLECYPSLLSTVMQSYNREVVPLGARILPEFVETSHEHLKKHIQLPPSMNSTLETLSKVDTTDVREITETCEIVYHRP